MKKIIVMALILFGFIACQKDSEAYTTSQASKQAILTPGSTDKVITESWMVGSLIIDDKDPYPLLRKFTMELNSDYSATLKSPFMIVPGKWEMDNNRISLFFDIYNPKVLFEQDQDFACILELNGDWMIEKTSPTSMYLRMYGLNYNKQLKLVR